MIRELRQHLTGSKQTAEILLRLKHTDGRYRSVEANVTNLLDEPGVDGLLCVFHDITELQQVERQLKLTQYAVDNSRNAVFWIDRSGRFIYANQAACESLQYSREELVQMTVPEIDIEWKLDQLKKLWAAPTPARHFRSQHRRRDGSVFPVEITSHTVELDNQTFQFASAMDITERQRAEQSLLESEQRFRTLVQHAPEAIVLLDVDAMRIQDCNDHAARMFGMTREELLTKSPLDFSPPAQPDGQTSADRARLLIQQAVNGEAQVFEWEHCDKQGRSFPCEVRLVRLPDAKCVLIRGSITDISDRKRIESDRERLIKTLEQKNAELERFSYTVSHDLKSPLITIKGFLNFLEKDLADGNSVEIQNDVAEIGIAADRMQELLTDLLELSRVGRLTDDMRDVSLDQLVTEAVESLQGTISARQAEIRVERPLGFVRGDRIRLREVVQNLLENSLKFTPTPDTPRIHISSRTSNGQVECSIKDNGIGLKADHAPRIFGLFEQLDATREGTGIGLALVQRIIDAHDGRIWVESEGPGLGATFRFALPAAVPSPVTELKGSRSEV